MYVGRARKYFDFFKKSTNILSELKELCLMSPYVSLCQVHFIFYELLGQRKIALCTLGGHKIFFCKLNEYSCKLSELKELCLVSPLVKFFFF